MESTLGIMKSSDLIKKSWSLFKTHWKILVTISAIPALLTLLGELVAYTDSISLSVIGAIFSIAGAIISIVLVPALIDSIRKLLADPAAVLKVKEQYRLGFTFFWSLLLVGIIVGASSLGSFALFIIPGIFVALYTCLYSYTLVIDGKKGYTSLTESYALIHGRLWEVFVRLLSLALLMLLITLIFMGIGFIIGLVAAGALNTTIIASILNTVSGLIITPISMIYVYLLYTSLKETRQVSVDTSKFKKWLMAFTVIGVLAVVLGGLAFFVWGADRVPTLFM